MHHCPIVIYSVEHIQNVEDKEKELSNLVDKFIFESPGQLRSYAQVDQLEGKADPYDAPNDDQAPILRSTSFHYSKLSLVFLQRTIQFYPDWVTTYILKKRLELLDADICGYGPPLHIAIAAKKKTRFSY